MSRNDDELRRIVAGRDPRVDPREGDVVRSETGGIARRVIQPHVGSIGWSEVCYQSTPRGVGIISRWCSMRAWRRWARGCDVVCRGDL